MFGVVRRYAGSSARRLATPLVRVPIESQILRSVRSTPSSRLAYPTIRQFHQTSSWKQEAAAAAQNTQESAEAAAQAGPITEFAKLAELGMVDSALIDNITRGLNLTTMTEVQTATINEALRGSDLIAQAKTGTGKTLAFLIPVVQRMIQEDPSLAGRTFRQKRTTAEDIRAIIISPTRELAEQIAAEATKVLRGTKIIVQTAVGGTQKNMMLRKTKFEGCHLLVGTPGRLKDVLSDPYSGIKAPALDALVLDEADRLMDQGFWDEVQEINALLPRPEEKDRQTLMFSATIPRDVVGAVRQTLKKGYKFVKCVRDDEAPTHERISQKLVQCQGLENVTPALYELCQREIEKAKAGDARPFKAMVFFNATAHVAMNTDVFNHLRREDSTGTFRNTRIIEIHSKLNQSQRTRAAEDFRRAESAIMFTSDVTARGMDFPNVTHVIQCGVPSNAETYTHRIGRTGRAGKEGEGWVFLAKPELPEARNRLSEFPLKKDESLQCASIDMTQAASLPANTASILTAVGEAHKRVDRGDMDAAYRASLGIFGFIRRKEDLVDMLARQARFGWGLAQAPAISPMLAGKLGISRIPGVNVGHSDRGSSDRDSFGGRRNDRNDSFRDRRDDEEGDALSGFNADAGRGRGGRDGGRTGGRGRFEQNRGGNDRRGGGGSFQRGGSRNRASF